MDLNLLSLSLKECTLNSPFIFTQQSKDIKYIQFYCVKEKCFLPLTPFITNELCYLNGTVLISLPFKKETSMLKHYPYIFTSPTFCCVVGNSQLCIHISIYLSILPFSLTLPVWSLSKQPSLEEYQFPTPYWLHQTHKATVIFQWLSNVLFHNCRTLLQHYFERFAEVFLQISWQQFVLMCTSNCLAFYKQVCLLLTHIKWFKTSTDRLQLKSVDFSQVVKILWHVDYFLQE